ncbi:GNAT family N-acetyltransferase [Sphingorhabdus sp. 109]|jgi:predicted N-acyltransferase|uniref:GNAT family N-acetyltransferase n=1 Tax=Sphingorhabdus sp. 109 TaxID=2653173 RepID=UPI0012F04381|nr:GNAT family N-acetyltransferase [Sphingorhabdus sp. 109]VWX60582.1 GNAT family N-acetyltransferase [Sphingorhabdus sp. 109]
MPVTPPTASEIFARAAGDIASLPADQWDACAGSANPFVSHAFLSAMEESGSVGPGTGWKPLPIVIEDAAGEIAACLPGYLKSHSQGEYIFDQQWAHAYENAGGQYYPKIQIAAPFSPVPGPRLLLRDQSLAVPLLRAAEQLAENNGISSVHATFVSEDQLGYFCEAGWMIRTDSQFHWRNDGYQSFDNFLDALSSRKRKAIRRERAKAQEEVDIAHLSGDEIQPHHWDYFWEFYQDTGMRKWGQPYLTREAFDLLQQKMGEKLLLIFAMQEGVPVAGALNVIGEDTLYGRYWGCTRNIPFLHFEICYYQAIDAAIARGLKTVEAGAQGNHKLARGYQPVPTWSAHYIVDPGFRSAIADYLERERQAVAADIEFLAEMGPFKKTG